MTTRQPIRRKSWAAWFPIARGEKCLWRKPLGRNTWTTGFGAIPDGATEWVVEWGDPMPLPRHDITANRNRWGMKP